MKRYPAFDPPEYATWAPDPALVRAFRETLGRDAARQARVATLTRRQLVDLYYRLIRARVHDIALKR